MSSRLPDVTSVLPLKTGHIFMGMALIMAILTGVVFKNMMSAPKPQAAGPEKVPTQPVVVSQGPVPVGKSLTLDDLKVVEWPEKLLPQGHTFEDSASLIGRIVKSEILPGEPIYREKLAGEASTGGLPVLIPKGLRAVTVSVSEVKEVAGFVKPGDRVDILATFEDGTENGKTSRITKTILQNALVIAEAQNMVQQSSQVEGATPNKADDKDSAKKDEKDAQASKPAEGNKAESDKNDEIKISSSITLALTPADAAKLTLADETGTIRLVLRSELDHAQAPTAMVSTSQLFGRGGPASAPPPPSGTRMMGPPPASPLPMARVPAMPFLPRGPQVELIEGTEKTSIDF